MTLASFVEEVDTKLDSEDVIVNLPPNKSAQRQMSKYETLQIWLVGWAQESDKRLCDQQIVYDVGEATSLWAQKRNGVVPITGWATLQLLVLSLYSA